MSSPLQRRDTWEKTLKIPLFSAGPQVTARPDRPAFTPPTSVAVAPGVKPLLSTSGKSPMLLVSFTSSSEENFATLPVPNGEEATIYLKPNVYNAALWEACGGSKTKAKSFGFFNRFEDVHVDTTLTHYGTSQRDNDYMFKVLIIDIHASGNNIKWNDPAYCQILHDASKQRRRERKAQKARHQT